jgi:hypothetical protein
MSAAEFLASTTYLKLIRHWSLILMDHCPARLPRNYSSRLPGGSRKSALKN